MIENAQSKHRDRTVYNRKYYKRYRSKLRQASATYYTKNKRKVTKWSKKYYQIHKEKIKEVKLACLYGITIEQYNQMLLVQHNRCAVCRTIFKDSFSTHVDHDHKTKKVRALLCPKCNLGLGCFNDDLDNLVRAAEYIKQYKV